MHARERVIRDRFAEQTCSHCSALYPPSSVVCLAHRRSAWIMMATCGRCGRQGIFVVTFPSRGSGAPLIQGGDLPTSHRSPRAFPPLPPALPHRPRPVHDPLQAPQPSSTPLPATPPPPAPPPPVSSASSDAPSPESRHQRPHPGEPITAADVDAMRDFLAHFEGDVSALLARRRGPDPDEPSVRVAESARRRALP